MNYGLSVELQNYALGGDFSGFGEGSQQDVNTLLKSLTAGDITGRDTQNQNATGGSVLKTESLENALKIMDFKESDIVLWKKIPKLPAYNTVEEYDRLDSYGQQGNSFNNEGELPDEDDMAYSRQSQLVKFMGKTGSVSHPMQLVNVISGVGNVIDHKVKGTTMTLLRDANIALPFGNSDIIPQEWKGLYKQHQDAFTTLDAYYNSDVVIDLKGKILTEAAIQQGSLALIENNGEGSLLMAAPGTLSDFTMRFSGMKYINPNSNQVTDAVMGQKVSAVMTQFGQIDLGYDKFMANQYAGKPKTSASTPTNPKAPASPATVVPALFAGGANWSGFTGDYKYAVTAVNRHGESAPTISANITVTANNSVKLTITAGSGNYAATGYKIYRTEKDLVTGTVKYHYLFSVGLAQVAAGYDGGAANEVVDKNRIIANTESAFLTDPTLDVFSFKQLAPIMKMDLAQLAPSTRYMVLLYGTPILYAPKKFVKFINIGKNL